MTSDGSIPAEGARHSGVFAKKFATRRFSFGSLSEPSGTE